MLLHCSQQALSWLLLNDALVMWGAEADQPIVLLISAQSCRLSLTSLDVMLLRRPQYMCRNLMMYMWGGGIDFTLPDREELGVATFRC